MLQVKPVVLLYAAAVCRTHNIKLHAEGCGKHALAYAAWKKAQEKNRGKPGGLQQADMKQHVKDAQTEIEKAKGSQVRIAFSVLKNGRPMTDYESEHELLRACGLKLPRAHATDDSGWEFGEAIAKSAQLDLAQEFSQALCGAVVIDSSVAIGEHSIV